MNKLNGLSPIGRAVLQCALQDRMNDAYFDYLMSEKGFSDKAAIREQVEYLQGQLDYIEREQAKE